MNKSQLLPLSGLLAIVLIAAGFIVGGETPATDATAEEVVSFYEDNETEIGIAAALLALGSFFFVLFTVALASALGRAAAPDSPARLLCLAGGVILSIGITIFAGLGFAASDAVDDASAEVIQTINILGSDMFFTVVVGTGAFLLGAGVAALRAEGLPRWLGWAAIVLGVVALTPLGFFAFLALGLWTAVVSVLLARRDQPSAGDSGSPPMVGRTPA